VVKEYILQDPNEFGHNLAEEVATTLMIVACYSCAVVLVNNGII
jgi:hypothetical protein